MQTEQIVALLIAERDRLSRAIEALQGPTKRRGRPPKNPLAVLASASTGAVPAAASVAGPKKRKRRTPSQRKAQAERMKAYWKARRAADAKK